ncbi:MAG: VWA domain-containing protein [Bryobacteraceae bacterium]
MSLAVALPQEGPRPYTIRSDVRLVLLDVAVTNHMGGLIDGLKEADFDVTENGLRQPITVFANNDVPVTVGILVDESLSMAPKRDEVLAAAETLISKSNPKDEIFVLNFNERVTRGLPDGVLFSDNINQLRSALRRGMPEGRTALNDAIVDGLEQLEMGRRDKKTLIVISDGGDNASHAKRREMMDRVERSLATIYTIGLSSPGDPDRDLGLLKELARTSGGEAYFPIDLSNLATICSGIAKQIRSRYTIGYVPPPGTLSVLRHIRVYVSAPGHTGLIAHTRTSYRYEPIESQDSN